MFYNLLLCFIILNNNVCNIKTFENDFIKKTRVVVLHWLATIDGPSWGPPPQGKQAGTGYAPHHHAKEVVLRAPQDNSGKGLVKPLEASTMANPSWPTRAGGRQRR